VPVQLVTTSVGGCLVSLTFGLLLIPLTVIWKTFFLWPLLGLSWAWDKVPLLRIPLAVVGIPLAAVGATYVALVPSMGDMESRVIKMVLCETWPFSLDYFRSLRRIDVPDYERLVQIKKVMWALRAGPQPDDASYAGQILSEDGTFIANAVVYLAPALGGSSLVGELRQPSIGEIVGPNRKLTIRCFPNFKHSYPPDFVVGEFRLAEYEVEPDVIKFKLGESALKRHLNEPESKEDEKPQPE
jgi:hypothetical protein